MTALAHVARIIVHLDADAFFASVEQAADPQLSVATVSDRVISRNRPIHFRLFIHPSIAAVQTACHIPHVSINLIEQQLTDLKNRVANLEAQAEIKPRDAWKRIVGISKRQRLDREAARLGAEWRAKANKRK